MTPTYRCPTCGGTKDAPRPPCIEERTIAVPAPFPDSFHTEQEDSCAGSIDSSTGSMCGCSDSPKPARGAAATDSTTTAASSTDASPTFDEYAAVVREAIGGTLADDPAYAALDAMCALYRKSLTTLGNTQDRARAAESTVREQAEELARLERELAEKEDEVRDKSRVGHAVADAWRDKAARLGRMVEWMRHRNAWLVREAEKEADRD